MSVYCHAREQVLWLVNVGKYHVVMGVDRPEKKEKAEKRKRKFKFLGFIFALIFKQSVAWPQRGQWPGGVR
jgi:hypothetical protein